ncbi:LOW QUALITY PROTEIN: hypothetical protein OSB04_024356 [Centaurea solstitialis]|uniref:Uncharacterized protein n=1 Tax=Centaurea solstitialis TaxID=347529 RepID=A0AA38SKZ1_9ASTR|nr:LOW QUALITY PROTEIN: hypothetical protein OSB04_024356 [Centaurea solstitialis]
MALIPLLGFSVRPRTKLVRVMVQKNKLLIRIIKPNWFDQRKQKRCLESLPEFLELDPPVIDPTNGPSSRSKLQIPEYPNKTRTKNRTGLRFVILTSVTLKCLITLDVFQQNPGEAHLVAVKNILKYLRRTKEIFMVFGGSEDEISVTGYSDASIQTDRDDYRSQSRYIFTLNGGAISWKRSKQDTIADSTTEAEYIAASDAAKEAVCDNSGAVSLDQWIFTVITLGLWRKLKSLENITSRDMYYGSFTSFERLSEEEMICKIPTDDNVADPLTKPLARVKHETHANSIGMQYLDTSS